MKNTIKTIFTAVALGAAVVSVRAQGTAFEYQGKLNDGGSPATGLYDLTFSLYDSATGGAQQGNTLTNAATPVTNGLFSVTLDFGNQFPGAARWLALGARTNGAATFVNLAPREQLLSMPYAIQSLNAATAASASSVSAGSISGTIGLGSLPSTLVTNGASGVNISGAFSGSGSGLTGVALLTGGNTLNGTQIITNGNVGIGTTTPAMALDISSPQGQQLELDGTNVVTVHFSNPASQFNWDVINDNLGWSVSRSGFDYPLSILENGAVAIGTGRTVAAGNLMEVGGNAKIDGTVTATAFVGDGSGLSNLPIPASSTNVALLTGTNIFNGTEIITNGNVDISSSQGHQLELDGTNVVAVHFSNTASQFNWDVINDNLGWSVSRSGFDYPLGILENGAVAIGTGRTVAAGNLMEVGGNAKVDGTVTATAFVGDGSGLSNLPIPASSTNVALLTGTNIFNGTEIITNGNVDISSSQGHQLELDGTNVVAVHFSNTASQFSWDVINDNLGWSVSRSGFDYPLGILENGAVAIGTGRTVAAGNLMEVGGNAKVDGTVTATAFVGDGSGLSNLPIPTLSTTNVAFLNSNNVFSGHNYFTGQVISTNASSILVGSFIGDGSGLTGLSGSQITNGTLSLAQLPTAVVTNGASGVNLSGAFSGNGSGLFNIAATNLVGTIADVRLSSNVALRAGGNTFNGTQIITNGSVGIGTTSPSAPLEVRGGNQSSGIPSLVVSGPGGAMSRYVSTTGGLSWDVYAGNSNFAISRSGNDFPFTIDGTTGNSLFINKVGIGTTTPTTALQVAGTVTATAFVGDGSGLSNLPIPTISTTNVALLTGTNIFNGTEIITNGNVDISSSQGHQLELDGTNVVAVHFSNTASQFSWDVINDNLGWSVSRSGFDYPLGILENGAVAIGTGRTVAAGNLMEVGGNAKVDGTVTATAFVGDGSGLTNLPIPATSTNAALLTGGNTFNGSQSITNGSVGIGTTSPSAPLEVRGGNQSSGIPSLVVSGPGGAMSRYVSTTGGLSWDVYAGNSNFAISRSGIDFPFTIDSTTGNSLFINKVGIGTSSPGTALQVAGTVTATAFVGDGSGLSNLPIPASSTNAALLTGGNTFNGSQSITNGSVGIGTTTPLATLEVSSPADSTRGQVISGPSGGFWSVYADVASGISGNHYLWDFKADTNSYRFGRSGVGTDFTMIYSNAFLGLGTPTPTSKLQVAGTVTATAFVGDGSGLTGVTGTSVSGVAMLTGGNTFNGAQIVTNGNVGIGTTAPLTPLEIRSSNSSRSTVFSGPGGGTWSTYDSVHSSYLWDVTGTTNQFSIAISGVGYPFYIAKSTGNVGIGTTTPQTALDVLGAGTVGPGILNDAVAMRVRSTASYGSMIALDATQLGGGDSWQLFSTGGGAGEGNGKFIIRSSNTGSEPVTVLNTGNVGIGNTSPGQLLVVGSGGAYCNGTTWVNGSDRNSKHAITAIDPQSVLQKISTMPITKWEYKVDPNGVEHIGPMAQDFHAAFGLNGGDDKHISTVDEGGVALAAIQALNQKLDEKNAEVEQLQHSVDQLTKLVDSLSKNK